MENQEKRLSGLEYRINKVDEKVDGLETKVDIIDDKHDERHLEMVRLTTKLQGSSEATQENTSRMANSIEGLVNELKQSNSRTDDRFTEVKTDIQNVRSKVEGQEADKSLKLEQKKLSNKTIGFIIVGIFGVLQVLIQVVAPLIVE